MRFSNMYLPSRLIAGFKNCCGRMPPAVGVIEWLQYIYRYEVLSNLLNMGLLLIALLLAPACTGILARVRDHFEKKFKKLERHLE